MKDLAKWSSSGNRRSIKQIPFNIPLVLGTESAFVTEAILHKNLSADGTYSQKCASFLESLTGSKKVIMTTSCTDALEMAAILANIKDGDEVIMASFNFVSAANAFVLRGAKIRFIDIDPITMNMDANLIESAISQKTKVIVAMHYAGVPCDMEKIMKIANQYQILVVEDAAHCIGAYYKGKHLGSIGHLGTLSFHETKNIQAGEGGALLINEASFIERATIIKDKGTNRNLFFSGNVKKYTWVDVGSSFGIGELNAAFLYTQLVKIKEVTNQRILLWNMYHTLFSGSGLLPERKNEANAHIFFLKLKNGHERETLINRLKSAQISAASHYEPLHLSDAGKKYGQFSGEDKNTLILSQQLLRLPLYYDLSLEDVKYIYEKVCSFYEL